MLRRLTGQKNSGNFSKALTFIGRTDAESFFIDAQKEVTPIQD